LATPDRVGTADPASCIKRSFGAAFARPLAGFGHFLEG
jgi:hypothetical protein